MRLLGGKYDTKIPLKVQVLHIFSESVAWMWSILTEHTVPQCNALKVAFYFHCDEWIANLLIILSNVNIFEVNLRLKKITNLNRQYDEVMWQVFETFLIACCFCCILHTQFTYAVMSYVYSDITAWI